MTGCGMIVVFLEDLLSKFRGSWDVLLSFVEDDRTFIGCRYRPIGVFRVGFFRKETETFEDTLD